MNVDRVIDVLERAKQEHYDERSGLSSCPAASSVPGPCECGADAVNAEIDALIEELRREAHA